MCDWLFPAAIIATAAIMILWGIPIRIVFAPRPKSKQDIKAYGTGQSTQIRQDEADRETGSTVQFTGSEQYPLSSGTTTIQYTDPSSTVSRIGRPEIH